jgi:F-type H+-transporting ATPase subunit b
MLFDAEFWVAIALMMFFAILGYFGVHRRLFEALDRRGARIRHELDEAHAVRQEAEAVLRTSHRRRCEVEREVERIMDGARAEAARLIAEAKVMAGNFVHRRTKLAEAKIAQAELDAVAEIRAVATDAAVAATEDILIHSMNGRDADRHLIQGIEAVKGKFGSKLS